VLTLKNYLAEGMDKIRSLSTAELSKFDKAISPYTYVVSKASGSTTTVIVRAPGPDRPKVKKDLESKLKSARIDFEQSRQGGSTGSTDVIFLNHKVRITYKPISGGMSETTLNATITELAPALAFMNGQKRFGSVEKFYEFLVKAKPAGVYVNARDAKAGEEFVKSMPSSSKYKEKMENAMAVLDYLWAEHAESPIQQVYWGYRAKPDNIDASHKGDLFIKYKNGNMIGVSLKAGGAKTAEPQLNTYVNKFFDDIGFAQDKQKLMDEVYNKIHSTIKLPKNWADRANKNASIDTIEKFRVETPADYEKLYDQMLEICRNAVIAAVNKSKDSTIAYIKKQVIKKDDNVPLVVVKAFGKKYKFVTDEDALDAFLPKIQSIKAYPSTGSKQNWFIDLIAKGETMTMNMSIRSNKPQPDNKIAQGFNLAIKFNGTK
jgi:hypothetical protein